MVGDDMQEASNTLDSASQCEPIITTAQLQPNSNDLNKHVLK